MKKINKHGSYNLKYSAKTRDEMLRQSLLSNVKQDACKNIEESAYQATHIVVGMTYGGSLDLSFTQVLPK